MQKHIRIDYPAEVTLPQLFLEVREWRAEGLSAVSLDFSHVELLDSTTIGFLVDLVVNCRRAGVRVQLEDLSPATRRALDQEGVADLLGVAHRELPSLDAIEG